MHWLGRWIGAATTAALTLSGCGDDGGSSTSGDSTTASTNPTTWPTFTTQTDGGETSEGTTSSAGTDTDGTTNGADTTTTDGPMVCPTETHQCVDDPPEGWSGPVARFVADATEARPPACEGAYPEPSTEAFRTIVAEPAQCGCECDQAQDVSCENPVTVRYWSDDATCSEGVAASFDLFAGICNVLPFPVPGDGYWIGDPIEVQGGSCAPIDNVNLPPAGFEDQVIACGGAELLEGCAEGRVCAPQPSEGHAVGLCIWQAGEHECPAGYPDEQALWGGLDDQRGCEPCSCGTPQGLCDASVIRMFQASCTGSTAAVFTADGQCHPQSSLSASSATAAPGDPTAFCAPSLPVPAGDAVGTDPVTLCCTGA